MKNRVPPYFLIVLIAGVCAIWRSEPVLAQDFMAGTVVSADLARMEIEIFPGVSDSSGHAEGGGKSLRVRVTPESLVVNGRGERVFPGCVYPGGVIRLWGQREEGVFTATDIRGLGGRGDPTGVRRRLQRMGPGCCPGGPGFRGGQP